MGESLSETHIDNDNVDLKGKDNDNDIVPSISEYKLEQIEAFLFGGGHTISDCSQFINPALKQLEHFMQVWVTELDDGLRKGMARLKMASPYGAKNGYKYYTNSPLWKYQSGLIKLLNKFTCQECQRSYCAPHLVVHHLSYEHLGSEFQHLEDVAVLCTDCHLKLHGIKGGYEQK